MSRIKWDDVEEAKMPSLEGTVLRRFVSGTQITLARIEFSVGAETEPHRHHNEQFSTVISGKMEFVVEGEKLVISVGEVIHLKSEQLHGARALEASVLLDVFSPPRTDWIKQ